MANSKERRGMVKSGFSSLHSHVFSMFSLSCSRGIAVAFKLKFKS